jgi:Periplasmic binding protein
MTATVGAVLSVTGRFARFGKQAADGLQMWGATTGVPVEILDDQGDPERVGPALAELARRCDVLLGPYSTALTRAAARFAAGADRVVWNHGGSGDDVQAAAPGRLMSVLTPTGRYAEPFVRFLAAHHPGLPLRTVAGRGSFGRQVVAGARAAARHLGVPLIDADGPDDGGRDTALFAAGTFEEDTAVVSGLVPRPRVVATVAAGVLGFADAVADPDGVLGVAQWAPGSGTVPDLGPGEAEFLAAWAQRIGGVPDYPAIQAVAAAAIALHCHADPAGPWAAATRWRGSTLFGRFGVDAVTGAQRDHAMVLLRWVDGAPRPVTCRRHQV